MKTKIMIGALVLSSAVSLPVYSMTDEQKSKQACERYASIGKENNPGEYFLDCSAQNRSPAEWQCMQNKRFKQHWPYLDAVKSCFKNAPALAVIKQMMGDTNGIKASAMCQSAVDSFEAKGEKMALSRQEICANTERTALMWICMDGYAKAGNSFMYSAGQCFPRNNAASQQAAAMVNSF